MHYADFAEDEVLTIVDVDMLAADPRLYRKKPYYKRLRSTKQVNGKLLDKKWASLRR